MGVVKILRDMSSSRSAFGLEVNQGQDICESYSLVGKSVKIRTQVKVGRHRQSPGSLPFGQRTFR